jgi:excisionase family DNA binding protein
MTERLLTPEQVADSLPYLSRYSVLKARRDGRLAGVRLGRCWAFREADVAAWLEAMRTPATKMTASSVKLSRRSRPA